MNHLFDESDSDDEKDTQTGAVAEAHGNTDKDDEHVDKIDPVDSSPQRNEEPQSSSLANEMQQDAQEDEERKENESQDEESDAELKDEDYEITGRKAPRRDMDSGGSASQAFASFSESAVDATEKDNGGVNMERPRLIKVPDFPMPQFRKKDVTVHMAQLPKIVAIQPEAFDEDTYNTSIEEEEFQGRVHSMIRWRYKTDADGRPLRDENGKLIKESNAKIIKWDDGSFGLCVGDEVFDMDEFSYQLQKNKAANRARTVGNSVVGAAAAGVGVGGGSVPSFKDFVFVTKDARVQVNDDGETQPMGTILECVVSLQSKFIPRPASLKSAAHKNFVLQERSRVIKRAQIQEYVTFVDPEKQKAERIRNKEDLMKQEKRSGARRSTGFDVGGAGAGSGTRRRHGMHRAYMEDDDERYDSVNIRNLKRRNMDDEDMDYGDDVDMSEEEDAWSKRKKTVFESGRKTGHLSKYDSDGKEEMNDVDEEMEFGVDDEDEDNDEFLSRKKQSSASGQKRQAALFDDDDDDSD